MTLEEVFKFLETKEAGKRSAGHLSEAQGVNSSHSQYRRNKQDDLKTCKHENNEGNCNYCGKTGHGKNAPPKVRRTDCPAYGKICDHCQCQNHFEAVCRSKTKPPNGNRSTAATEAAICDSLCATTSSTNNSNQPSITLDHHLYHHLNNRWVRKPSKPQPLLTLTASVHLEDYEALGFKLRTTQVHPT